jgi:hypothetical protein
MTLVGWLDEQTARSGYVPALSQRVSPSRFPHPQKPHGAAGTRVSWPAWNFELSPTANHLGTAAKLEPINVNAALNHGIAD